MTAIGAAGTSSGFVIAADGRKRLSDEFRAKAAPEDFSEESDEAQKIFPIIGTDKVLAYGTSGFIKLGPVDILREIERKIDLLSHRQFDNCRKYLTALSSKLNEELNAGKATRKIDALPMLRKTEDGSAWKILDLVVVGYFKNFPTFTICSFNHSKGRRIEYEINSLPANQAILLGSEVVRKAMYPDPGGVPDVRFAQYAVPTPIKSLQDGIPYVKGYVAACSCDLARELDPKMSPTGGHIHIAKITPRGGFEWVRAPKSTSALI